MLKTEPYSSLEPTQEKILEKIKQIGLFAIHWVSTIRNPSKSYSRETKSYSRETSGCWLWMATGRWAPGSECWSAGTPPQFPAPANPIGTLSSEMSCFPLWAGEGWRYGHFSMPNLRQAFLNVVGHSPTICAASNRGRWIRLSSVFRETRTGSGECLPLAACCPPCSSWVPLFRRGLNTAESGIGATEGDWRPLRVCLSPCHCPQVV